MMQTANMEKQGCTILCRIITQTFGLFRANPGLYSPAAARKRPFSRTRRDTLLVPRRENSRVPVPRNICLAVASVPINETDAFQLGVGLDLLVNPADVGSPGAFEGACPCLCARRFAPAGSRLLAYLRFRARRLAPLPPACSDFFDFPQICAIRPRQAVFFWLKEGRQGDLRQRNAIDAGRPANVQR